MNQKIFIEYTERILELKTYLAFVWKKCDVDLFESFTVSASSGLAQVIEQLIGTG